MRKSLPEKVDYQKWVLVRLNADRSHSAVFVRAHNKNAPIKYLLFSPGANMYWRDQGTGSWVRNVLDASQYDTYRRAHDKKEEVKYYAGVREIPMVIVKGSRDTTDDPRSARQFLTEECAMKYAKALRLDCAAIKYIGD